MAGHVARFRLLLAGTLCVGVGACLSTEGYYRYQDAGPAGSGGGSGNAGNAGNAGTTGHAGTTGGAGTTGAAGSLATAGTTGTAGRGGTTGTAGRGGTTGTAGRGGTTGAAGSSGTTGGGVLFSEDFDPTKGAWDWAFNLTHSFTSDGSQMMVVNLSETAGDQAIGAVGMPTWTNYSVEAKVKVNSFTGTSSSDGVAICARLTSADSFYYLALSPADTKALKIKLNNGSNTSLSSSLDSTGFAVGTWVTLRLDVQGNVLTAYLNGTMKGTYTAVDTDKILPMGGIGLMVQRASAEFDDIVVRALP